MSRYFIAVASDGTTFKRSSVRRVYSHCVAIRLTVKPHGGQWWHPEGFDDWWKGEWASHQELAYKNAGRNRDTQVSKYRAEILEAREVTAQEYRAIEGRR